MGLGHSGFEVSSLINTFCFPLRVVPVPKFVLGLDFDPGDRTRSLQRSSRESREEDIVVRDAPGSCVAVRPCEIIFLRRPVEEWALGVTLYFGLGAFVPEHGAKITEDSTEQTVCGTFDAVIGVSKGTTVPDFAKELRT